MQGIQQIQQELTTAATGIPEAKSVFESNRRALSQLANMEELGPDRQGLNRILYFLSREVDRFIPNNTRKDKKIESEELAPTLIRIPVQSIDKARAAQLWLDLFLLRMAEASSVLTWMPQAHPWIDVILGIPTAKQIYCLKAMLDKIPLTSSIPFEIDASFLERINAFLKSN